MVIGDQKRRLTVLENAFSSLIFCLDDRASQLLVHNLSLEAQNQNHDEQLQQLLKLLIMVLILGFQRQIVYQ